MVSIILASEPPSGGCGGPFAEATMENRMNELERKLDDMMRLLRDQRRGRPRGRSPPRRDSRRVNAEDRWRAGPRRREVRHTPLLFAERTAILSLSTERSGTPHPPTMVLRTTTADPHGEADRRTRPGEAHAQGGVTATGKWNFLCSWVTTRGDGWSRSSVISQ